MISLSQNTKRYIISSLVTFFSAALLVTAMQIQSLDWTTLSSAAITGIVITALRAGVKSLAEYLIQILTPKPQEPPQA